jgi:hypothetical protein
MIDIISVEGSWVTPHFQQARETATDDITTQKPKLVRFYTIVV